MRVAFVLLLLTLLGAASAYRHHYEILKARRAIQELLQRTHDRQEADEELRFKESERQDADNFPPMEGPPSDWNSTSPNTPPAESVDESTPRADAVDSSESVANASDASNNETTIEELKRINGDLKMDIKFGDNETKAVASIEKAIVKGRIEAIRNGTDLAEQLRSEADKVAAVIQKKENKKKDRQLKILQKMLAKLMARKGSLRGREASKVAFMIRQVMLKIELLQSDVSVTQRVRREVYSLGDEFGNFTMDEDDSVVLHDYDRIIELLDSARTSERGLEVLSRDSLTVLSAELKILLQKINLALGINELPPEVKDADREKAEQLVKDEMEALSEIDQAIATLDEELPSSEGFNSSNSTSRRSKVTKNQLVEAIVKKEGAWNPIIVNTRSCDKCHKQMLSCLASCQDSEGQQCNERKCSDEHLFCARNRCPASNLFVVSSCKSQPCAGNVVADTVPRGSLARCEMTTIGCNQ